MAGFGGSVKLTGESEYRKALQNITKDLSKMSSALKTQPPITAQTIRQPRTRRKSRSN